MSKGLTRSLMRGDPQQVPLLKQVYTIDGTMDITGVDSAVDAGTFVIGGLPQGNLLLVGAVAYVSVEATGDAHVIDNWDGDFGIGYAPQNDVDLDDVLEDAIIPSTELSAGASDKIAPRTRGVSTQTENGVIVDNTDGSLELNFNLLIDDNVITDDQVGTFNATGHLILLYSVLGDD